MMNITQEFTPYVTCNESDRDNVEESPRSVADLHGCAGNIDGQLEQTADQYGFSGAERQEFVGIGKAVIGYLSHHRHMEDSRCALAYYYTWVNEKWRSVTNRKYEALKDIARETLGESHKRRLVDRKLEQAANRYGFSGEERKEFINTGKDVIGYLGYQRHQENPSEGIRRYCAWVDAKWNSTINRREVALRDIARETLGESHKRRLVDRKLEQAANRYGFSGEERKEFINTGKDVVGYLNFQRHQKNPMESLDHYYAWVNANWDSAEDRRYEALRDIGRSTLQGRHLH